MSSTPASTSEERTTLALDDRDRALVAATQAGLPLVSRPFAAVAERLGWTEEEVLDRFRKLHRLGALRRIAAVPNHYRLGYRYNGMVVWDVPDPWVDEMGERLATLPFVTHCYRRPRRLPVWPYNLFTMIHARDEGTFQARYAHLRRIVGVRARDHRVLLSRRILKKTGMRSFRAPGSQGC